MLWFGYEVSPNKAHLLKSWFPLLGAYQKEYKADYNKGTCTPMFTAALFTKNKLWK
jgi:hypothetical protein